MALEAEAVNLANELVNAKMDSQRKLETVEEKVVHIQAMFEKTHHELAEMQEQKQNLEAQVEEVGCCTLTHRHFPPKIIVYAHLPVGISLDNWH